MPSTRSRSSRTITPSQKKCANQEVDPPRGHRKDEKHRKSPPESPSSSGTASDESEEQVAPRAHKQGLDPANCEFTLQHTIYLDGQRIACTSKQYNSLPQIKFHFPRLNSSLPQIKWFTSPN